ncbi:MAG: translation initiation factor, aIF-2BI family [Dehalococcoidia bacterium]|nr:translation initiation factor, aIF-2BI family [Dehalococcoidia bacterium]
MKTIEWLGDRVRLIDQTALPQREVYLELSQPGEVAAAIREMRIRGAPAIGVAGAYAVALAAQSSNASNKMELLERLRLAAQELVSTRPTAVNLAWAVNRMLRVAESAGYDEVGKLRNRLIEMGPPSSLTATPAPWPPRATARPWGSSAPR